MSINGGMVKESLAHIYSGILAMTRNKILPFAEMWMDLETVIWSEVSHKEKNKCCILTHTHTYILCVMASLTQWTESEQALGDGEGRGSLACSSPGGRRESDMT